jgi:hypothetical protein
MAEPLVDPPPPKSDAPSIAALRREVASLTRRLQAASGGEEIILRGVLEAWREPPELSVPPTPRPGRKRRTERAVLHVTDTQIGKLTESYSAAIAEERLLQLAQKVAHIANIRRASASIDEILVLLGGDMIEGENIFPGQAHQIDQDLFEQSCKTAPAIFVRMLLSLLGAFRRVRVAGVSGNHGRPGPRSMGSGLKTNWDRVCYQITRDILLGTPEHPRREFAGRLEFDIAESFYSVQYVYDWGLLLVHGDQIRGGFAGFPWYGTCVPTSHEILTRRGWKRHDELFIGEDVLAFDPQTHENRWEPLGGVNVYPMDGELSALRRPGGHEFLFTANHRWPTIHGESGHRSMKRACDINSSDWFPVHGEYQGDDSVLSPRHAALLGWVVTDGYSRWTGNHWEATIYQSPRKFLREIEALAGRLARLPRRDGKDDVQCVPLLLEDSRAISAHFKSKDDLPALVPHLSREAADAMFDAMMKAEGSKKGGGHTWK